VQIHEFLLFGEEKGKNTDLSQNLIFGPTYMRFVGCHGTSKFLHRMMKQLLKVLAL